MSTVATAVSHVETGATAPLFKKRGGKSAQRRREAPVSEPTKDVDSDASSGYSSNDERGAKDEDAQGPRKRRKRQNLVQAQSESRNVQTGQESGIPVLGPTRYEGDRSSRIDGSNDATKQSHWDDEKAVSIAAMKAKKSDADASKGPKIGPTKGSGNVRSNTMMDFAPDVCKDYKQTGFCGFGDSCKFLHAREDYKQGWQLDKDWEMGKGKKDKAAGAKESSDPDDVLLENIPFACIICKQSYRNPIVTKCSHYFCEPCALQRYRKNPTCAACGAGTSGVFNGAKQLKRLLERKTVREKEKAAAAEAEDAGS